MKQEQAIELVKEIKELRAQSRDLGAKARDAKKAGDTEEEKRNREIQKNVNNQIREIRDALNDAFSIQENFGSMAARNPERTVEYIIENNGYLKGNMFHGVLRFFED